MGGASLLLSADPAPETSGPATVPSAQTEPAGAVRGPASQERLIVHVNYTPASDLAITLSNHFQLSAADVHVIPDILSNSLLITAPSAKSQEIRELLQNLDRRPKSLIVEATLLECAPIEKSEPEFQPLHEKEFNGPAAEVAAKVEAAMKSGQIKTARRLQLRTIDNQLAQVAANEGSDNLPAVPQGNPGGGKARPVGQAIPGTVLSVTSRIADDENIVMELSIVDSRTRTQSDVALTTKALTTFAIKSGEAIVVHAGSTTSTSEPSQVLVIVSASIVK